MATTYKVLGQTSSSTNTEYTLYTAGTIGAVVSSIIVCNRGTTVTTFRVSVSVAGAATTTKDYIYYNVPIAGNDTFIATVGITLDNGDVLRIYSANNNLSFQAFGTEIS